MANKKAEVVEQPKKTLSMVLTEDLEAVKDGLPEGFNITRFVQNSVALLNDNEQLQTYASTYGTKNIKAGIMRASYLGLDFISKEAYLIPYGNKLNFMIDYRGNVKLCKKYSIRPIKDIYAKIVRVADDFEEVIINGVPSINYRPLPFNDGNIIGAFGVCLFEDGGILYDTMSLKELENTRSASKAKNSPAWTKFTEEMYKKTVLHRLCKHIELDFDNPEQKKIFDEDMECEFEKEKPQVDNPFSDDEVIIEGEGVIIEDGGQD